TLDPDRRHDAAAFNFDHPDSLDTERLVADLDRLVAGHATDLPRYDFARHAREDVADLVVPRPVILVEGILVLAIAELRARLDPAVFVDCPDDIRLIRRIRRDVHERGRTWEDVCLQYEHSVRPMHEAFVAPSRGLAELVVDGREPVDALVAAVRELIG